MKASGVLLVTALIVVMTASVWGAGSNEHGDGAIELRLATNLPPDHTATLGYQAIADEVRERSDGRLVITVFPSEQLGREKDVTDAIANNTGDMAVIGPGEMAKRFPAASIFDAPYVFEDADHLLRFANGEVGRDLWNEMAAETNIRNLGMIYYGTRHVTTSRVEATTPTAMDGLKLRVPDQEMALAYGRGLGARPTPMAFGEVYLALQQGVVDGQENPIPTIVSAKFYEVQRYLNLTGHVVAAVGIIVSEERYRSLPEDLRAILDGAVAEGVQRISEQIRSDEASMMDSLVAEGMRIVDPDRDAFRANSAFIYEQYESTWGAGLYELIQSVR